MRKLERMNSERRALGTVLMGGVLALVAACASIQTDTDGKWGP